MDPALGTAGGLSLRGHGRSGRHQGRVRGSAGCVKEKILLVAQESADSTDFGSDLRSADCIGPVTGGWFSGWFSGEVSEQDLATIPARFGVGWLR